MTKNILGDRSFFKMGMKAKRGCMRNQLVDSPLVLMDQTNPLSDVQNLKGIVKWKKVMEKSRSQIMSLIC